MKLLIAEYGSVLENAKKGGDDDEDDGDDGDDDGDEEVLHATSSGLPNPMTTIYVQLKKKKKNWRQC